MAIYKDNRTHSGEFTSNGRIYYNPFKNNSSQPKSPGLVPPTEPLEKPEQSPVTLHQQPLLASPVPDKPHPGNLRIAKSTVFRLAKSSPFSRFQYPLIFRITR